MSTSKTRTLQSLRERLIVVIRGYEKRGKAGDEASAATARTLRKALAADRESRPSRGKPEPVTTCSGCGKPVTPSVDRPGGTASHHVRGAPCAGADLPFAAHDEVRAERAARRQTPKLASFVGLFGPMEEGSA